MARRGWTASESTGGGREQRALGRQMGELDTLGAKIAREQQQKNRNAMQPKTGPGASAGDKRDAELFGYWKASPGNENKNFADFMEDVYGS
jgi:hypothetical protein